MTQVTSKTETVGDLRTVVEQLDKLEVDSDFKIEPKRGGMLSVDLDQDNPSSFPIWQSPSEKEAGHSSS